MYLMVLLWLPRLALYDKMHKNCLDNQRYQLSRKLTLFLGSRQGLCSRWVEFRPSSSKPVFFQYFFSFKSVG